MFTRLKNWFYWLFLGWADFTEYLEPETADLPLKAQEPVEKKELLVLNSDTNENNDINSLIYKSRESGWLCNMPEYPMQYVQNEIPEYHLEDHNSRKVFILAHSPAICVTGTVYMQDIPCQSFWVDDKNGAFNFKNIHGAPFLATNGHLSFNTGHIYLEFEDNALPNYHLVVSYEYEN